MSAPRYLLDTNILSELGKPSPNPKVVDFVARLDAAWLSIITVHEIEYGLNLLPAGKRRTHLEQMMETLFERYGQFIIPVDHRVASQAAQLRAYSRQQGQTLHLADALIASSAVVAGNLTLATRNLKDFTDIGLEPHIKVISPF